MLSLSGARQLQRALSLTCRSGQQVQVPRRHITIGRASIWVDTRGGNRESGYRRFLEYMMAQDSGLTVKEVALKWKSLQPAERDSFERRALQQAPLTDPRGKPIRDLPLPAELTGPDVKFTVIPNKDIRLEGISACVGADLVASVASAVESATNGRFNAAAYKKYRLATAWDKLSDNRLTAIYKYAVGFLLFCLEQLDSFHDKRENRPKKLWVQLEESIRQNYIERGMTTKIESGQTLWELVSPSGSWQRWRLLFICVARDLNFSSYDDWYTVSRAQLDAFGAHEIIRRHYHGSYAAAVMDLFPEYQWHKWKFTDEAVDYWDKLENRRRYFKFLSSQLGIADNRNGLEAWYDIPVGTVLALDSGSLIKDYYKGDLVKALRQFYPDHPWLEWRFSSVSRNFWKEAENRRAFFTWLAEQLKLSSLDDWYQVAPAQVRARGGGGLLNKFYNDSLVQALKEIYPNHQWEPYRFKHVPPSYWDDIDNQRAYFDWFMRVHDMKTLDHWYGVKATDIPSRRVISKYRYSMYETLKTLYPYHPWDPSKFGTLASLPAAPVWLKSTENTPSGPHYMRTVTPRVITAAEITPEMAEARAKFEGILRHLNLPPTLESWYSVTMAQLSSVTGTESLMPTDTRNSLLEALAAAYPEHSWYPWLFLHTPTDFWKDQGNQAAFLQWLRAQLQLGGPTGFYRVTIQDIKDYGGGGLAKLFKESVYDIMRSAFPMQDWLPWKFAYVPQAVWADQALQRRFFASYGSKRKISSMDQWYQISSHEIEQAGAATLLELYDGSLHAALAAAYPDHAWKPWRFSRVSNGYWKRTENQLGFFEDVKADLGINHLDDWYKFSTPFITSKYGVETLFEQYPGPNQLHQALENVYPQHFWDSTRFATPVVAPTKEQSRADLRQDLASEHEEFVDDDEDLQEDEGDEMDDPVVLRKQYVRNLGKILNVSEPADWRKVTREQLKRAGEIDFLDREGGLAKFLRDVYPNENWDSLGADMIEGTKQRRGRSQKS